MEPEFEKQCFSSLSHGEMRHLIEEKDSANIQKASKNDVASLFVFHMEVSAEQSPPKNLQKLSRLELTRFLFFLSLSLYNKTLHVWSLGKTKLTVSLGTRN